MSTKSKMAAGCAVVALLLSGCGSSGSSSDSTLIAIPTTTVPAAIVEGAKKLELTQKWDGNSVSVALYDSKGHNCIGLSGVEGEECFGYYFGWSANFEDKNRVVTYDKLVTISSLQKGDKGNFLLMYQAADDSDQYQVREFPFEYNG